jgi:hypothetical protein
MPPPEQASSPRRRKRQGLPLPRSHVEYLLLADKVEVLNRKLYMMGGGWDNIVPASYERPVSISIACGVVVPWNETDDTHKLTVTLEDADGQQIVPPLSASIKTGRHPALEPGASTHLPFAIAVELILPGPGSYTVRASMDDNNESARSFTFYARERPKRS